MLTPQLNRHQIKIYNIFSKEYKLLTVSIFSFSGLLLALSIFFPDFLSMALIFGFGGIVVTCYLWYYQASKKLTKSYILSESEGTEGTIFEWLEVWLEKDKILEDTPTDFIWSMDLNPMKKNEPIVFMDSSNPKKIIPFDPFEEPTTQTKVSSLDVARTLEQSASKRLFNSKAELMETIGVGILVGAILGVGYGIIMLIESGSKSGV